MSDPVVIVRPAGPVSIIRSDGRVRINTGGPGLRGLPGATGAAGGFTGSEPVLAAPADTDEAAIKSGGSLYWVGLAKMRSVTGFYPRAGTMSSFTDLALLFQSASGPSFVDPTTTAAAAGSNGVTVASTGAFIDNNTDFGGTAGAMTAQVVLLCNAAAAASPGQNYQYGQPFHVARFTAGSGTASPGSGVAAGSYLSLSPFNRVLVNAPMSARFMARAVTGSHWISRGSGSTLFKNGVADTASFVPLAATFTHYIEHMAFPGGATGRGYAWPLRIYSQPGAIFEIALPDIIPGHVNLPFVARPLLAGNRS